MLSTLLLAWSDPTLVGVMVAMIVVGWLAGSIAFAAGLGLWGTTEQAHAATNAAQTQANAATQAAQIQQQTQQQALLYAAQQAQQSLIAQNATQQANYNQWAAQQQRLSQFGQDAWGQPARVIPPYQPIPGSANPIPTSLAQAGLTGATTPAAAAGRVQGNAPTVGTAVPTGTPASASTSPTTSPTTNLFGTTTGAPPTSTGNTFFSRYGPPTTGAPGTTSGPTGSRAGFPTLPTSGDPTSLGAIQQALAQNYAALGVSPTGPGTGATDAAYYAQAILNSGGLTAQNFPYWFGSNGRIATDLARQGGATSGTAAATTSPTMSSVAGVPGNSFLNYVLNQQMGGGLPLNVSTSYLNG